MKMNKNANYVILKQDIIFSNHSIANYVINRAINALIVQFMDVQNVNLIYYFTKIILVSFVINPKAFTKQTIS